jgi:hypothetical protein
VREDDGVKLDLGENHHPIMRDITDPANAVLFQAPFLRGFMRLQPVDPEVGARTILTYTDLQQSPALVERRFGRGRALLLTTTVDDLWGGESGGLPACALFPVFLHELVYVTTSKGNDENNLTAFETYSKTFPSNFEGFEIRYPDGSPARADVESPPDAPSFVSFTGTDRLGVYRTEMSFRPPDILAPAPPAEAGVFTVGMTPLESDLQRLDAEEIDARYQGLVDVTADLGVASDKVRAGSDELHGKLLAAALLCLLGEVALARHIGRRRARS